MALPDTPTAASPRGEHRMECTRFRMQNEINQWKPGKGAILKRRPWPGGPGGVIALPVRPHTHLQGCDRHEW